MSETWKNERAEHEMRESDKKIMEAAALKEAEEKKALEDKAWDEIKANLHIGDSEDDKNIDWVIEMLSEKYELPKQKK